MGNIGEIFHTGGFVTRQLNIQGQTLGEIEHRLGYHQGRLAKGAKFYVLQQLPSATQFELAGYTQVAGHHTTEQYGDINNASDPMLRAKKAMAAAQWSLHGSDRLVKTVPFIGLDKGMKDDDQFPPGSGIQQWKIIDALPFRLEAIVLDYPNGRFIPLEGYQAVKYK